MIATSLFRINHIISTLYHEGRLFIPWLMSLASTLPNFNVFYSTRVEGQNLTDLLKMALLFIQKEIKPKYLVMFTVHQNIFSDDNFQQFARSQMCRRSWNILDHKRHKSNQTTSNVPTSDKNLLTWYNIEITLLIRNTLVAIITDTTKAVKISECSWSTGKSVVAIYYLMVLEVVWFPIVSNIAT